VAFEGLEWPSAVRTLRSVSCALIRTSQHLDHRADLACRVQRKRG
jgi:hypothetical protein